MWRREVEGTVGDAIEPTLEAERSRSVEAQAQDGQGLLEPGDRMVEGKAVWLQVLGLSRAETQDRWSPREMGEREHGLGEQNRMAADRIGHADAEAEPPGVRAQAGPQGGGAGVARLERA